MADRVPLSVLYRDARERVARLVEGVDGARPVPATPDWSVHDVVAHLVGVAQDLAGGRLPVAGPTPEWTAGQVERGREVPLPELIECWQEHGPAVEIWLDAAPRWPPVIDLGSHEQDLRGALGVPGARDSALVTIAGKVLLGGLRVPAPLLVTTERQQFRLGPEPEGGPDSAGGPDSVGGGPVCLETTTFEAFRWRMGRRSRGQLAAMRWTGDPTPFLDHLCVFGPADQDVIE